MVLQPFIGPWPSFQFLELLQSVRLLARGMGPSQAHYLHTWRHKHRINAHGQPCVKWDSNPRSQCLSGGRRRGHCNRPSLPTTQMKPAYSRSDSSALISRKLPFCALKSATASSVHTILTLVLFGGSETPEPGTALSNNFGWIYRHDDRPRHECVLGVEVKLHALFMYSVGLYSHWARRARLDSESTTVSPPGIES
jgi:hypothetical protein